ncbi:pyrroline-5-carboxylate reductase [Pelagibacterium montanilacus]|uniref:pyrroline-5-carboxylate reductase n=1 Tax=Pelagibacterium montanilacus TaxID=2185280 RepID=UPI000F8E400F|nr:pyrroline-5-carboxylate reductase [Pelagibacterium montanilacus]
MSLHNSGTILLVGAGKMGIAMAQGWLAAGLEGKSLVLVDPQPHETVRALAESVGASLQTQLPDTPPRAVVLAVKPQMMDTVLPAVRPLMGEATMALSIAAGIPLARLQSGLGSAKVVRSMPNTPAQLGKGISGAFAGPDISSDDRALAHALLEAAGRVVWLENEALIDAVTSVSGSGPAYVFYLVEAMAAAGEQQGLAADQAMALARQTIIGAAALLEADPADAAQLRRNVTSPNGTTQAALDVLMADDGLGPLLDRAVTAARKRSEELGQ